MSMEQGWLFKPVELDPCPTVGEMAVVGCINPIDRLLFAAEHIEKVEYGPPAIVYWFDGSGKHETRSEIFWEAIEGAILEYRKGG